MKTKLKILLLLLFVAINASTYYFSKMNSQAIIDIVLKDNTEMLDTHYKVLVEVQAKIAKATYRSTIAMARVVEIMRLANTASVDERAVLRDELHDAVKDNYEILQEEGVLQYHFVLANNESFYRAHKPNKFGDDLTNIREDFKYANEKKEPVSAFVQGRVAHGFRNTFPLFDTENNHIGAIEVSFASDSFEWYLNHISAIHSHFIVDKDIFDAKAWQSDDLAGKYEQSAEHKDYMIALGSMHTKEKCVIENAKKLLPVRGEIESKVALKKAFSLYVIHTQKDSHTDLISFVPILGMDKQVLAWMVSYDESALIESTLLNVLIVKIVLFFLSLGLVYYIYKHLLAKEKLRDVVKEQETLLSLFDIGESVLFKWNNDEHWSINYVSQSVQKLLHYDKESFMNGSVNYVECIHKNDLARVIEEVRIGSSSGKDYFIHEPYRVITKDNTIKWVIDNTVIERDADGTITHYIGYISDITEMKEQQIMTEKKANIDGLTQVYNRAKFDEVFESELKKTKRYQTPLSIAIIDIDKFKDFNDNYGHLIGDEVLITMAQTVNKSLRETDTFARWGGEEFVILFQNTPKDLAEEVSQELRIKIQENKHDIAGTITASFGVTQYQDGDTAESIFERCDEALYLAKENGRNRVEVL